MGLALPTVPAQPRSAPASTPPRSVRLSLTDRCDLACVYCRPNRSDGYFGERLDRRAWATMFEGLVRAGVRRVRLTGGEPLLHADVVEVVAHLATLGLDDLALTTNGTRLAALAAPLRDAGLRRLNVSVDTLSPERFERLTRGGTLSDVLAGIEAALAVGFDEIKLNTVVLLGENDHELADITRWAWERGIVPRFLEVMLIGEGARYREKLVSGVEMRARLGHLLVHERAEADTDRGPARYVRARHDARLRVGFITGTSHTYCDGCDRLRVGSDGSLRPCLASNQAVSAAEEARSGDASAVHARVDEAWSRKPDGKTWRGCTEESARKVSIRSVGG